ncbi:MAG: hypothetical protein AVO33_10595 [delta proteobacterium ML8_F1]|nr:MAG: hypothetical protein AVO33_10595 [delta proteobacterium ML8_F1]
MKAAILTLGNEVLAGKTLNTNSQFLSKSLNGLGFDVVEQLTIPDDEAMIITAVKRLLKDVTLLITTGGLGPTYDDITIASIARALGRELVFHEEVIRDIEEKFKRFHRKMGENNRSQAYFPAESVVLPNAVGTAPGMYLEHGSKIIIALPGPPRENIPMFDNETRPLLEALQNKPIYLEDLVIFGIGESDVEDRVKEGVRVPDGLRLATYVKPLYVTLRLTSTDKTLIQDTVEDLEKLFGDSVVGRNDCLLEEKVQQLLKKTGRTLSVAESCTGGLIASMLVSVPGSSEIFDGGFIVYSNDYKSRELGVAPEVISKEGAVSEAVARLMVEGLYQRSGSDYCLGITGIAGPTGETPDKRVGLTFIALKTPDRTLVRQFQFFGDRNTIRLRGALNALNMLRLEIVEMALE